MPSHEALLGGQTPNGHGVGNDDDDENDDETRYPSG